MFRHTLNYLSQHLVLNKFSHNTKFKICNIYIQIHITCSIWNYEQIKISWIRVTKNKLETRSSRSPATLYGPDISAFMPRQQPKFTKLKYFVTLTCSHGGVKVKMMYMLQIYIVHSIDWYQHWRNRWSSFGGEANTNYYPSAEIIHKIEVFRDLDLQSWKGPGQNEVHVAHLHCSLSWLVSSLEKSVK